MRQLLVLSFRDVHNQPVPRSLFTRHFRRLRTHGLCMLLAVFGLWACRRLVPRLTLEGVTELAGNFLQTFGGIYGVIVAFVIYVVWQQHIETQVTIEREAGCLCELFRLLNLLKSWPARQESCGLLLDYARAVPLANEPSARGIATDERKLLEQSLNALLAHEPSSPQELRFYDAAHALFRQLIATREHRRTVSALRLPEALRWFVFMGGAGCVVTLWLVWVDAFVLQAFFAAGMTWVVVAASSIVLDLDDPYSGDFIVDWQRFHVVEERMRGIRGDTDAS